MTVKAFRPKAVCLQKEKIVAQVRYRIFPLKENNHFSSHLLIVF